MDHLQGALDALTSAVADAIAAGFGAAFDQHQVSRDRAAELRDKAMAQALLGPALSRAAEELTGAALRKTVARYETYRLHPRLGREPLIDEAEAADVSLNTALLAAQGSAGPMALVALAMAIIRVRAITIVIGPECIYPPHRVPGRGRAGPRQRRREITAADVPGEVADILLRPVGSEEELSGVVTSLRALERSGHNTAGLVTKIIALIDQPDGHIALNTIAGRIRRARYERGDSTAMGTPSEPASGQPSTSVAAGPVTAPEQVRTASETTAPRTDRSPAGPMPAPAPALPAPPGDDPNGTASAKPLRTRFEQQGTKVTSARERLAQAHAERRRSH